VKSDVFNLNQFNRCVFASLREIFWVKGARDQRSKRLKGPKRQKGLKRPKGKMNNELRLCGSAREKLGEFKTLEYLKGLKRLKGNLAASLRRCAIFL